MGKDEQIVWYSDEEITIKFDKVPDLDILFPAPNMTEEQVKQINKKPFICDEELFVTLIDEIEQTTYEFLIPKGYTWDGATIPRMFWRLIGPKSDNRFLVPSLIHDVLCENHDYIDGQRYLSTIIFERLLYVSRVNAFYRWIMKHSVDNAQKFCGWEN